MTSSSPGPAFTDAKRAHELSVQRAANERRRFSVSASHGTRAAHATCGLGL